MRLKDQADLCADRLVNLLCLTAQDEHDAIAEYFRAAFEGEREACAQVCEDLARDNWPEWSEEAAFGARVAAGRIRARGNK